MALGVLGGLGFLPFFLLQRATSPIVLLIFGLTPLYLCCGCLLALVLLVGDSALLRTRVCRAMAFLGRHSYGIYLWHLMVRYFVWRWGDLLWGPQPDGMAPLVAYLVISLLVGVGSSLLIEVPFLKLRERLVP